ncbi:hypothetical protein NP233_g9829 [Leucocoprinus birnbaumii]|uniref:Uncharacterized protein n=1 Tax=Leucocoprinus birnbaumii TaxID=56174 RepID=A0AAD5VN95_9AGAR|nr:hypothetical protein NP233_g9829 [Leucocoprinus birnbaumii]
MRPSWLASGVDRVQLSPAHKLMGSGDFVNVAIALTYPLHTVFLCIMCPSLSFADLVLDVVDKVHNDSVVDAVQDQCTTSELFWLIQDKSMVHQSGEIIDEDGNVTLPFSHMDRTFEVRGSWTRANHPQMYNESTCIIVFRLSDFDRDQCTAQMVYGHLKGYFPENDPVHVLSMIEIPLDWSTPRKLSAFKKKCKELSEIVKGFRHFIVFISTHATDDGCFWVQPEPYEESVTPEEFFDIAFTLQFRKTIAKDPLAAMFILTCGGPFTTNIRQNEILTFASPIFWLTIGFVKERFHPSSCQTFMLDLSREVFIHRRPHYITNILLLNPNVGAGTESIMIIQKDSSYPFVLTWSHDLVRPNGNRGHLTCPKCRVLRPWKVVKLPARKKITLGDGNDNHMEVDKQDEGSEGEEENDDDSSWNLDPQSEGHCFTVQEYQLWAL